MKEVFCKIIEDEDNQYLIEKTSEDDEEYQVSLAFKLEAFGGALGYKNTHSFTSEEARCMFFDAMNIKACLLLKEDVMEEMGL